MATNITIKEKEEKRLLYTLDAIDDELKFDNKKLKDLYKRFDSDSDNPYLTEDLIKIFAEKIENLQNAKDKPYFARIDFKETGDEKLKEVYIGKTNVIRDTESVVVDWRAPISSLYYDGRLGDVSYEAPLGTITGELLLKRLFEISEGKLESILDIDITASDELLKPYLSSNSDTRLKNIIATIQTEQNKIIRTALNKPLIVQGVAGSGKTTVALHRIAYLAYTYEKQLRANDFLIIAPNKFFLDYISAILPDLGVNDVKQLTFEEFAQSVINSGIKVENSNDKLANIINDRYDNEDSIVQRIATFKSSFDFKEILDNYLKIIEENYLPKTDLAVGNLCLLSYEEILKKFQECSIRDISLEERLKILRNKLSIIFENNMERIEGLIYDVRQEKLDEIERDALSEEEFKDKRMQIYDKYNLYFDLIKNKGKKLIANYISQIKKYNVLECYKEFILNIELYIPKNITVSQGLIKQIQINLLSKNNKQVEYEDLAPLMYIAQKIKGGISYKDKMPSHIVVDEAQDYSAFQFFALKNVLKNNSMTILGDIAQGIYSYRGTKNWEEVNEKVFDGNAQILGLNKSYRTTMEIMNKGNEVISSISDKINVKLAEPVIRQGVPVFIGRKENQSQLEKDLVTRLRELLKSDNKNIAIITKTLSDAKELVKRLDDKEIKVNLISNKETAYTGGISVVPSYLVKGLEFDAVIILNADSNTYKVNELDAKLLYIAITRAMHILDIYYIEELTPLLKEENGQI